MTAMRDCAEPLRRLQTGVSEDIPGSETPTKLQASPLAAEHARLGARMAAFAGWDMPIQYGGGIVAEHRAVRESGGVFDISHMGQIRVGGAGAARWLNRLLTNDLNLIGPGEGQYTLMPNEAGGVIDDLIAYRETDANGGGFFLVVNASKIGEDFAWLKEHADFEAEVSLKNASAAFGGIAVQGPRAAALWEETTAGALGDLPPRNGMIRVEDGATIVCRTGYTGEDGFELFAPPERIAGWFRRFVEAGAEPCGLGARDTLRLEKGYPLNGADLDPVHTPLEAGLGFFCKLDKAGGFIGRDILARQKAEGLATKLSAIRRTAKGPPPRHGYAVFPSGEAEPVAELTSGTLSPTLGCGIGLAYLPAALARAGTPLEIEIRGRRFAAEVVKKPFV